MTGVARERFKQTAINGANRHHSRDGRQHRQLRHGQRHTDRRDDAVRQREFPERYEGMLVRLPQELVISEYFNYNRFGEIVLALPLDGETRHFTPTSIVEPGPAAKARGSAEQAPPDHAGRRARRPEPGSVRHPNGKPFSLTNRFRGGDSVTGTVGVLGFDFSLYRIQPTEPADYAATNPRPGPLEGPAGIHVAAMNTLNFFLTLDTTVNDNGPGPCGGNQNLDCRGADADQPLEFTRQRDEAPGRHCRPRLRRHRPQRAREHARRRSDRGPEQASSQA